MTKAGFARLVSEANLTLAWRRVTTARNLAYKKYFRGVQHVYENAAGNNIRDLSARLSSSFSPTPIGRIFQPKPSGLHRAISLLSLEDQIIYQGLANIVAQRVQARRNKLWGKCIFSNKVVEQPNGIFFMEDWRDGFRAYEKKVSTHYKKGRRWVAQFDLAAFYDTISHDLLFKTVFPTTNQSPQMRAVATWIKEWASQKSAWPVTHGIPQGPIASDLLAEAFLLPVDEWMHGRHAYIRYVDDIRLFGKTELEVLAAVRDLERLMRDRGLVPQSKKFEIINATSVKEALGSLPSIKEADPFEQFFGIDPTKAEKLFKGTLAGRPAFIKDKSTARYVLFRASANPKITSWVLKLIVRHPEHIDAFLVYLAKAKSTKRIARECENALLTSPSDYVRGELLGFLAKFFKSAPSKVLINEAIKLARDPNVGVSAKVGALKFLCRSEQLGAGNYSRWIFDQSSIVQSLTIPHLPVGRFKDPHAMEFRRRNALEANLALIKRVVGERLSKLAILGPNSQLSSQVRHVLAALGISRGSPPPADPMGEILAKRLGCGVATVWRPLFGADYAHNLSQLVSAEASFHMNRTEWLNYQNSFNHALFWELQDFLKSIGDLGATKAIDRSQFGNLLESKQPFARVHPRIAKAFEEVNRRRNKLPSSHPFDKKTGKPNRHLSKGEQTKLVGLLRDAFTDIVTIAPRA